MRTHGDASGSTRGDGGECSAGPAWSPSALASPRGGPAGGRLARAVRWRVPTTFRLRHRAHHGTALDVLAEIGIADPIPEILHYALPRGCTAGTEGRLRFPRDLVEELIGVASRGYVRYAVDPALDQEVSGERVYFSTSGEAVSILDYDTQSFRPSRLADLYDAARLVDRLAHIHGFGQPFVATEHSGDLYVHDMNIAYAALAGQRKRQVPRSPTTSGSSRRSRPE